VKHDNITFKVL